MMVFNMLKKLGHEQVIYFNDERTGLKGITAIHNTVLGPALGGTRLWNYKNEEDALTDVLRLSRGMTYKAAVAGLNLGGGKTVLIGEADKIKSEEFFRSLGRFVQSLNGRYITAEDVNTTTSDMSYVAMETDHVVGLSGKSGNPSPMTSLGTLCAIRACLKEKYGTTSLEGKTFAVQGAGKTGYYLIRYLLGENEEGDRAKKVYFTEINLNYIERMRLEHPEVEYVEPAEIYGLDVDVFAPCALGAIIDENTIPHFRCKIIAGTANNVLREERFADTLKELDILYAPDFVSNGGGLINVYHELLGYNKEKALADVRLIYDRVLEIFKISKETGVSTNEAAIRYAEQRIEKIKNLKSNYIVR